MTSLKKRLRKLLEILRTLRSVEQSKTLRWRKTKPAYLRNSAGSAPLRDRGVKRRKSHQALADMGGDSSS